VRAHRGRPWALSGDRCEAPFWRLDCDIELEDCDAEGVEADEEVEAWEVDCFCSVIRQLRQTCRDNDLADRDMLGGQWGLVLRSARAMLWCMLLWSLSLLVLLFFECLIFTF